ncbi:C6 transcription factor [Gigaspora margarita]|uniref:C6 transcription factor n=1 Tax=Gigaspora margarita TaxID=4874 RepID=A0A8H4ACM4_GIGMA|nr:C6 transcription factor [Gigaspora margarita]
MDIMRNRLRRRAHVTNACTNCKQRRKKCSGTSPCLNCKKRKIECAFIKSNERRGRKPRPKASPSISDEFIYLNRDLSTLSTSITPQVSTNIVPNEPQADITTISTFDERSTHTGLPIIPITESSQTISTNNNNSISFLPASLALYPVVSTNNYEYYSAPNVDYSLSLTASDANELLHEQYQFPGCLLPVTCEHDGITSNPLISQYNSINLNTSFVDDGSISLFETDTIYPQQSTLQFDSLRLDSPINDPYRLNSLTSQSEILEQTNVYTSI